MVIAIARFAKIPETFDAVLPRNAMRLSCTHQNLLPVLAVLLVAFWAPDAPVAAQQADSWSTTILAASNPLSLDREQKRADALVKTLPIEQALGPLAPVALSPFFALTCLSGASLVADTGILPDAVSKNALIGGNGPLNNGAVFAGLLALTCLTAAPKLTKVTKPFAQAIDQVENYSGIIAVLAVQGLAQIEMGGAGSDEVTVVYQAGIFTFSYSTLVMAFSAINIFVINTVKFFFEVLILLSPLPAVDAMFEAMNKAFAAFLMAVYLFSPWVAMVLNLGIFLLCLIIFAWVFRRVTYMRHILGDPFFGWFARTIFRRPRPTVNSTALPLSISRRFPDAAVVVKGFAGRNFQGLKRKMKGYAIYSEGRLHFAVPRFPRAPLIVALPSQGHNLRIESGLLSNTISVENDAGQSAMSILITRAYNPILNDIRKHVGGVYADSDGKNVPSTVIGVGRSLGAAVKGVDRDALRGDFA